jgi:hypothetical protein
MSESVAKELETGTLTEEQRSALTRRRDDTVKQCHALQLALNLLERQDEKDR